MRIQSLINDEEDKIIPWREQSVSELTKRMAIGAPADKIWEVLADFSSAARWTPTTANSRSIT
jgi:hypothetical protein